MYVDDSRVVRLLRRLEERFDVEDEFKSELKFRQIQGNLENFFKIPLSV